MAKTQKVISSVVIKHRADTSVNWNERNPILQKGELGIETDTGKIKIGDGTHEWQTITKYIPTSTELAALGNPVTSATYDQTSSKLTLTLADGKTAEVEIPGTTESQDAIERIATVEEQQNSDVTAVAYNNGTITLTTRDPSVDDLTATIDNVENAKYAKYATGDNTTIKDTYATKTSLNDYYTKTDVDGKLANYVDKANVVTDVAAKENTNNTITVTIDGVGKDIVINNVANAIEATKATGDGKGNNIEATYATKEELKALGSALKYKGSVDNYSDLPTDLTEDNVGEVYNIINADEANNIKAGDNVVWSGTAWDNLGGVVDLSAYAEKATLKTVATSGSYDDLINKPTIPAKVSELDNDSKFITNADLGDYVKTTDLATVATSGSYSDLTDTPTIPEIPTKVSTFDNDAGYLQKDDLTPYVKTEIAEATYAKKTEVVAAVVAGDTANTINITTGVNETPTPITINNVANATYAKFAMNASDVADNATIPETYATKKELEAYTKTEDIKAGVTNITYVTSDTEVNDNGNGTLSVSYTNKKDPESVVIKTTPRTEEAWLKINSLEEEQEKDIVDIKFTTAATGDSIALTTRGGTTSTLTIGNAGHTKNAENAEKATADASGDVITATYAKKKDVVTAVTQGTTANTINVTTGVDGTATPITINDVAHATEADKATKATNDGNDQPIASTYAKVTDTNAAFKSVANDSNDKSTLIFTPIDGTEAKVTVNNVAHATEADKATKATQDNDGNNINTTYVKNTDAIDFFKDAKVETGNEDTIIFTQKDNTTVSVTVNNVDHAKEADTANKATYDGNDQPIASTYATKAELGNYATTASQQTDIIDITSDGSATIKYTKRNDEITDEHKIVINNVENADKANAATYALDANGNRDEYTIPATYAKISNLAVVATSGSYSDLTDTPTIPTVPTVVSAFANDSGYALASNLAVVATSGSYSDLTDTPTIPTVPTVVSAFANDAGYALASNLAAVATSGKYSDLTGTPTIPAKVSELENDSKFITNADLDTYATKEYVNGAAETITASGDTLTIYPIEGNSYTATISYVAHATEAEKAKGDEDTIQNTYAKKTDLEKVIVGIDGTDATWTVTYGDKSKEITVNNVAHATTSDTAETATKATGDGKGNNIEATYATKEELKALGSALKYKGSVDNYSDLPTDLTEDNVGEVYNIINADEANNIKASDNVVWSGTAWDNLGGVVDLSAYALKSDCDNGFDGGSVVNGNTIKLTRKDAELSPLELTVTKVENADKANAAKFAMDADGNQDEYTIPTTYAKISNLAYVATSGSYTDLTDTPNIPAKVSELDNDSKFITNADLGDYVKTTDINDVAKTIAATDNKLTITKMSSGSYDVTIDNVGNATNATYAKFAMNASDVADNATIPETYAKISNLAVVATSGSYSDLTDTPTIPTVPTVVSAFTNDKGYALASSLAAVATSGSYSDLTDTPTIPTVPTVVSAFANDKGYITTADGVLFTGLTVDSDDDKLLAIAVDPTSGKPNVEYSTGSVGNTSTPIYLNNGTLTAFSSSIGSATQPVYLNNGALTASTSTVGGISSPIYLNNGVLTACTSIVADSASKDGNGSIIADTYAKKTDLENVVVGITGSNATWTVTYGTKSKEITINNVAHATASDTAETATKATCDKDSNDITTTYVKVSDFVEVTDDEIDAIFN